MRVNVIGSANVLEAASQQARCDRVVCFSTSEIFGQMAFRSCESEGAVTGRVCEDRWTYGVSKLAEEHLAIAYCQEKKHPVTVVRPFHVYGTTQTGDDAILNFNTRVMHTDP